MLEVLIAAEGGVAGRRALERAWDENADPFTNAVRITVSALRNTTRPTRVMPRSPASATASTRDRTPERGGRAWIGRGMSVRLKLTLSYAGFLMLAGGLLLATVLFLLRRS